MTDDKGAETALASRHYLEVLHRFTIKQSPLTTLHDICWNIAETAIADLGFEDCVVYLLKEDGETLTQVAAHGPKNPRERTIHNPIEIRVGDGIVGHVAQSGEPLLLADVRNDSRYIVDDAFRLSELAVPILYEDRVIGVLDSEHSEPHFFSEEHVQLFTTIASLASTRIETAMAIDQLERSVDELSRAQQALELQAEDLKSARIAAESASVAKSYFLANMSHEIRTPMTAIVGFAGLLANGRGAPDEIEEWHRLLTQNSHYLQGLIGNILDVSAIEAEQISLDIETVDLEAFLLNIFAIAQFRAQGKALALHFEPRGQLPSKVKLDAAKVQQILLNLLTNAIKYTELGSIRFAIAVSQRATSDCDIRFEVEDTGIGIKSDVLTDLFTPFTRVHDTKRHAAIEGTGLGLAISQRFAKLMSGSISVTSSEGAGSQFVLELPVEIADDSHWQEHDPIGTAKERPATSVVQAPERLLEGRSVLLCEDSDTVATLLRAVLEQSGAKVEHCVNGLEGVHRYEALRLGDREPDLVIMDMQMPVMDGYEATKVLKHLDIPCPILALTAFAGKEDETRCLEAGCDAYMTKPIEVSGFAAKLLSLIEGGAP
jgi:signal transduction histidine kinase/CheY-like chemotaxis protein